MDNFEQQKEELYAVESIFNLYEKNFTFKDEIPLCGHFNANVWLPTPYYVTYNRENVQNLESNATSPDKENLGNETILIQNLPPINLFFELPDTYPSSTCPAFLLTCNWLTLSQLSKLCKHLESLWDKDMPVLYTWFQFLESEVIEFLSLSQHLDVSELLSYRMNHNTRNAPDAASTSDTILEESNNVPDTSEFKDFSTLKPTISGGSGTVDFRAINDLADGRTLINILKNYDDFKTTDIFNRKYHECDVCMTSKIGTDFILFKKCSHAFCKECLKGFFEVHIREGNVNCLNCPMEKCDSQADSTMVKQVVDKNLFERYDTILLSRTLETMSDIEYCPRKTCQSPVLIDPSERMGRCPSCTYVFCLYCKLTYHGVAPCTFKAEERQAIFSQYVNGDESMKELLEKKHGKKPLKALVEDILSENWKKSNSKGCPSCKANIEKSDGCNKMTCFKCGVFFCWACMEVLNSTNPYHHFNNLNAQCILFPEDVLDNEFDFGPGEFLH